MAILSERKRRDDSEGREKALQKIEGRLMEIQGYLNKRRYARHEPRKKLKPP